MIAFANGIANSKTVVGQYTINLVPLSAVKLSTSLTSPRATGIPITLTATATGGLNVLYEFRITYVNSAGHRVAGNSI